MHVALVAGEPSGDLLGADLIEAVRRRVPHARFTGIAGPRMEAAGCRSLYPMERLSVMGLVEAAGRYLELIPVRRRLARDLAGLRPDVFVGIDAPDFNLGLAGLMHARGTPTVHYVSPSVWAWRRWRLRTIRRSVDQMLVLFPFERSFYARYGVSVQFVGHPLADVLGPEGDRDQARSTLGLPARAAVVALLPGSRMSEVQYLAEPLADAARWLAARRPRLRFVVPLVSGPLRERFQQAIAPLESRAAFTLLDGGAHTAMAAADVVLLASGTASLEALLLGRPMVVTYRTHPLTWALGRRMLHVEHVSLPNLLAGRALVPELLQSAGSAERLGAEVLGLLESSAARERQTGAFRVIHERLRRGASRRAADAVLAVAAGQDRA